MFYPGDIVVYRHRVCEVTAIRAAYFDGRDYFEFRALFEKSLKFYVAIDGAEERGVRPVMNREQALALVDSIVDVPPIGEGPDAPGASTPSIIERHLKEEYERRLKASNPEALLPILKSAHVNGELRKQKGRQPTATDKKYFDLAESLLCDELSCALGIPRKDTPAFLDSRIRAAEEARR